MDWVRRHARGRPPHPDVLTPAEWRVLAQLREQRSNAEIASELGVSVNTVRTHVSSMLAKTGLRRREDLAVWPGEPATASRRSLSFAATRWLSLGAAGAVAAVSVVAAIVVTRDGSAPAAREPGAAQISEASPTEAGEPTASPTEPGELTASPTAVPTATPGPPRLERFAAGETIDVAPAVVFVDPETGEAEAWVIPGAAAEFAVAPDGSYVVYQEMGGGVRLLRTDDASDRAIEADSLPLEVGPGDSGFIATTQDRFVVSVFDGQGQHLRELWLGGVSEQTATAWSPDGSLIAYAIYPGSGSTLVVTLRSPDGSTDLSAGGATSSGGVSLEWSKDSQRVAVVTEDWVRVFGRDGALVGGSEGEFGGPSANPRWSEEDAYLLVDWMPQVGGGEVAYLFTPDADPIFRFFTPSYAGGCGGQPWVDGQTIEFGEYDLRVDGSFELHGRERRDVWSVERLGVTLAAGIDFHIPHLGMRDGYAQLSDERLVFSTMTSGGGHGGCGEAWSGSRETEPRVEFPPYAASP